MIRNVVRTLIVYAWILISTIVFGIMAIGITMFKGAANAAHVVARIWGKSIVRVNRTRVEVSGLSKIDPSRPYIYMANHQSHFDVPVLLAYLPVQFRWLAKAELFKIPIFGRAMRGCGYISIDRSDRRSAIESLRTAAETIRNGSSVMIFPEGTRSPDGNIGSFKKGGFVLAIESGVPIAPLVIHGTRSILPRDHLLMRAGNVSVEILDPIETSAYTRNTKEELMKHVRDVIVGNFENDRKSQTPC